MMAAERPYRGWLAPFSMLGRPRSWCHSGSADDVADAGADEGEVFRRQAQTPIATLSRAEALRQGMLAIMTGAQGKIAFFAHPYAWAPFVLVGEGGRENDLKGTRVLPSSFFGQRNEQWWHRLKGVVISRH